MYAGELFNVLREGIAVLGTASEAREDEGGRAGVPAQVGELFWLYLRASRVRVRVAAPISDGMCLGAGWVGARGRRPRRNEP